MSAVMKFKSSFPKYDFRILRILLLHVATFLLYSATLEQEDAQHETRELYFLVELAMDTELVVYSLCRKYRERCL